MLKKIPIIKQVWNALRHPTMPLWLKILAIILSATYLISPFDIIPDFVGFLFGIGYLDDIMIIGAIFSGVEMAWERWNTPRE